MANEVHVYASERFKYGTHPARRTPALLRIRTARCLSLRKARNRRHATARTPAHTGLQNICGRRVFERWATRTKQPSPFPTHRCSPEAGGARSWTEGRSRGVGITHILRGRKRNYIVTKHCADSNKSEEGDCSLNRHRIAKTRCTWLIPVDCSAGNAPKP